jgi:hypothetical protein
MATVMPDAIIQMMPQVRDANQVATLHEPVSCGRYEPGGQVGAGCEVVEPPEKRCKVTMLKIEWKRVALLVA